MEIAKNSRELCQHLAGLQGNNNVAFVPTMGNLHDGHLSLVRRGFAMAEHVVVSIFVNPLQFSPTDDLDAYPRTLEQGLGKTAETTESWLEETSCGSAPLQNPLRSF